MLALYEVILDFQNEVLLIFLIKNFNPKSIVIIKIEKSKILSLADMFSKSLSSKIFTYMNTACPNAKAANPNEENNILVIFDFLYPIPAIIVRNAAKMKLI